MPRPPPSFDHESSVDTLPPTPTEEYEKRSYLTLVEEGGRPLYALGLIDEVVKDPFSYWDMLRPWVEYPSDSNPDPELDSGASWSVFGSQLWSWRMFRDWQQFNRGDNARWDHSWNEVKAAYNSFVPAFRRRCPTYTDAVRKLLAEYGLDRPLLLLDDPICQDKLTSWIEYVGYECWIHYRYASRVKRLQPAYDAEWKTLVDSGLLRPFETQEYICKLESSGNRQIEEDQAARSVASARAAGKAVLASAYNDVHLTSAARERMMVAAKSRCEAAEQELASIERRNDLITAFKQSVGSYLSAKRESERHDLRVRWAVEQIPLVEAELSECSMDSATAVRGKRRRHELDEYEEATQGRFMKRQRRGAGEPGSTLGRQDRPKRSRDVTADAGPPSKRLKRHGENVESHRDSSAREPHEFATTEIEETDDDDLAVKTVRRPRWNGGKLSSDHLQQKTSTKTKRQPVTSPQPLRRSARIAARQERLEVGTARFGAAKYVPESSRRSTLQASLPRGSQDQLSRISVTTVKKQGARRKRH